MNPVLLAFVWLMFPFQIATEAESGTSATTMTANSDLASRPLPDLPVKTGERVEARNVLGFVTKTVPTNGLQRADLEHSGAFKKAAKDAWNATRNGTKAIEAGFSIDQYGHPGKIQTSMGDRGDAAHKLKLISSSTAMGTLHVHNKFGVPTPSENDIRAAQTLHKMVYVASQEGLYSVDPDGNVLHVFEGVDWFNKK
jgi:hypothetical protein